MTVKRYANQYCVTVVYSFLGDRVYLEFEKYREPKKGSLFGLGHFLFQLGGDHLLYLSITLFDRGLTFGLFPTD